MHGTGGVYLDDNNYYVLLQIVNETNFPKTEREQKVRETDGDGDEEYGTILHLMHWERLYSESKLIDCIDNKNTS